MTSTTVVRPPDLAFRVALRLALIVGLARLALQFALTLWSVHIGYGYFRDEFYYLACGRHLAWGYVDHGPIVAVQARLDEMLFGESVFAIRILSAVAGAVVVALTGLLTWALGGRRPAQFLAMLCVALAPGYLGADGYLSMNSFEPVFWMFCTLALILMLRHDASQPRWWTLFGISAGIGLLNKPSMVFFLVAIGVGLLCTPQRRILFTRWTALGIALMFFVAQLMQLHPLAALVWITGIVALLRAKSIRNTRWLGIAFLVFFALMCKMHAKDYYLVPFYPALFAAGGIAWEHRFAGSHSVRRNSVFAFPVLESILTVALVLAIPMAVPILAPNTWVRYTTALHMHSSNTEVAKTSILPQFFADRFGWDELTSKVNAAFHALPPEDQRIACISTDNYGEAGAIDFFNRRDHLGLPPAISRHNNYWLWGPHGCTAQVAILFSDSTPAEIATRFESVQVIGHLDNPLIMPYEHKNIYLVRHRRPEHPFTWWDEHYFI
jgi:hypothetical protein